MFFVITSLNAQVILEGKKLVTSLSHLFPLLPASRRCIVYTLLKEKDHI